MNLKHPFFAVVLLALTWPSLAAVDLTRDEAAAIKSLDLQDVEQQGPKMIDQVVKLKCTRRGTAADPLPDGTYSGILGYYTSNAVMTGRVRSGMITTVVPKEGLEWFMKLPTIDTRKSVIVFAKLTKGQDGLIRATLLGRELKTDIKGSHIVW